MNAKVVTCSDPKVHPYEHYIYTGLDDLQYIKIKKYIYRVKYDEKLDKNELGINLLQRNFLDVSLDSNITFEKVNIKTSIPIAYLKINISTKSKKAREISLNKLKELLKKSLNKFIIYFNQEYVIEYLDTIFFLKIKDITKVDDSYKNDIASYFEPLSTEFEIVNDCPKYIEIVDENRQQNSLNLLLKPDFSFEEIGVGGLDNKFAEVFRRAFASRIIPQSVVKELGINHIKGLLLYGPPGTGKTRLARSLSNLLGGKKETIKVVNGPEILNKFVGASEEKIRELFFDAENEYKQKGDNASLHVIVFDEIDAICKARGLSTSPGADTIVNQILTKIDGIDLSLIHI
jgi:vesicle-fusing ATPase